MLKKCSSTRTKHFDLVLIMVTKIFEFWLFFHMRTTSVINLSSFPSTFQEKCLDLSCN